MHLAVYCLPAIQLACSAVLHVASRSTSVTLTAAGLSVATVVSIDGRKLTLGGADIVDGSPVLDMKPYLPFCDSIPGAVAPEWVRLEGFWCAGPCQHAGPAVHEVLVKGCCAAQVSDSCEDDPVAVAEVIISARGREQLEQCWAGTGAGAALRRRLFPDLAAWLALVQQTLGRDIRSVHQRLHVAPCGRREGAEAHERSADLAEQECMAACSAGDPPPRYQVVLQGVRVMYDINADGVVHVRAAHVASEGLSLSREQDS
jgi:hypothetical protein